MRPMDCPACSVRHTLRVVRAEDAPPIHRCPACGGTWLRSADYWRWRAEHPRNVPPPSPDEISLERSEEPELKSCPEDAYVLARFRVGPGDSFSIDQCRTCGGVWFDPGEWGLLEDEGLHLHLHHVLSEEWEEELKEVERRRDERERWIRQLGEENFERISEVKAWLDDHPKRSELYAFLRFHERAV